MRSATYAIHILAGVLGLATGFVALWATKGARLHRRAGMAFVYAMLATTLVGMTISAVRGVAPAVNIPAAALTAYLVVTGLTTVRPPSAGASGLSLGALLVVVPVTLANLWFGIEAIDAGGKRNGIPAFPFVLFAVIGTLAAVGDLRVIRGGVLRGAPRLARHLWRMCFAMLIAALSFFIGQAKVFPKPIRIFPLLVLPVLAVLVTMLYWLWRVRIRKNLRGIESAA